MAWWSGLRWQSEFKNAAAVYRQALLAQMPYVDQYWLQFLMFSGPHDFDVLASPEDAEVTNPAALTVFHCSLFVSLLQSTLLHVNKCACRPAD